MLKVQNILSETIRSRAGMVSPKATSEAERERKFLAGKFDSVFLKQYLLFLLTFEFI